MRKKIREHYPHKWEDRDRKRKQNRENFRLDNFAIFTLLWEPIEVYASQLQNQVALICLIYNFNIFVGGVNWLIIKCHMESLLKHQCLRVQYWPISCIWVQFQSWGKKSYCWITDPEDFRDSGIVNEQLSTGYLFLLFSFITIGQDQRIK